MSEENRQLTQRLITELSADDRTLYESLPQNAQSWFLDVVRELRENGTAPVLKALWDIDYVEKPISPERFLFDPYYLGGTGKDLWDRWVDELVHVLDPRNQIFEWIITGSIGTGKTTVACCAMAYKLYYLSCLRNPQNFFGFTDDAIIVFALFNVHKWMAMDNTAVQLNSILTTAPYFKERFKPTRVRVGMEDRIELPKKIRVVPGASATHVLGLAVYGGLLDEMNFRDRTHSTYERGAKAFDLYNATKKRIESRWTGDNVPGLLCNISSTQSQNAFLEQHIEKLRNNDHAHVSDFALWKVKGHCNCEERQPEFWQNYCKPAQQDALPDGSRRRLRCRSTETNYPSKKYFYVRLGDRYNSAELLSDSSDVQSFDGFDEFRLREERSIIRVPVEHKREFERDLDTALMDLAGEASRPARPLIHDRSVVRQCLDRSLVHPFTSEVVKLDIFRTDNIEDFVKKNDLVKDWGFRGIGPRYNPDAPRFIHVDLGETGCSAGFAMVHCAKYTMDRPAPGMSESPAPVIQTDIMLEIPPFDEKSRIDFEKIRRFIFFLRDLNFKIACVTYDGYQSSDSVQYLLKAGMTADKESVDKNDGAYVALQQAMFGKRFVCYEYPPFITNLMNLNHDIVKHKVDHSIGGAKDVSDAVAGATFRCIKSVSPEFSLDRWKMIQNAMEASVPQDPMSFDLAVKEPSSAPPERRLIGLKLKDGRPLQRR